MKRCLVALSLVAAPMILPAHAWADAPASAAAADADPRIQEEIQRLYRESKVAGERGDWGEAYRLMQDAWRKRQAADVAVNLGYIEMQLGKWRDAAEHVSFGLTHFPADADPALMRLNRERLDRCKQEVVTLTISVRPETAEVSIGGVRLGPASTLPTQVFVDPGIIEVTAAQTGHRPETSRFTAGKGEAKTLELALQDATAASSQTMAAPPPPSTAQERASDRPSMVPVYALGALAVVGLGAGFGYHFAANSKDEAFQHLKSSMSSSACTLPIAAGSDCASAEDANASYKRDRAIAVTSFAVGGAAAVSALGYYFIAVRPKTGATSAKAGIGATPYLGGATLSLAGTF